MEKTTVETTAMRVFNATIKRLPVIVNWNKVYLSVVMAILVYPWTMFAMEKWIVKTTVMREFNVNYPTAVLDFHA
jgi:hypothetical protein